MQTKAILNGLDKRLADVFADTKSKLAAAVHPKFKTEWSENMIQKLDKLQLLKANINQQPVVQETAVKLSESQKPQDFLLCLLKVC